MTTTKGIYRKTVVGIPYQGSQILIVQKKHWDGWIDFPQGGVEEGESLEKAVLRELTEELGTDRLGEPVATGITVTRAFSPETFEHYADRGNIGKEQFYFAVPFVGNKEEIKLGDDLVAYRWYHYADVIEKIYDVKTTEKVLDFMQKAKLFTELITPS